MLGLIELTIHPVFVHFALALIVTAALCAVIAAVARSPERRRSAMRASDWMLGLGVMAVAASIAAGLQAYYTVVHDGPSHIAMTDHRNWALASAVLVAAVGLWRYVTRHAERSRFFAASLVVAAIAVSATAARGGTLVYQYGLGVAALPQVSGDGHDHHAHGGHDHGGTGETADPRDGQSHDRVAASANVRDRHENGDRLTSDEHAIHNHSHADSDDHAHGALNASSEARSLLGRDLLAVANAFAQAIRSGDADAVEAVVAEDLWVAEGGGLERSFAKYASHHLPSDMAFAAATTTTTVDQRVITGAHMAVVISEFQLHGEFRDKSVHSRLVETLVLAHQGETWCVRHLHWSSATLDGEHSHQMSQERPHYAS